MQDAEVSLGLEEGRNSPTQDSWLDEVQMAEESGVSPSPPATQEMMEKRLSELLKSPVPHDRVGDTRGKSKESKEDRRDRIRISEMAGVILGVATAAAATIGWILWEVIRHIVLGH